MERRITFILPLNFGIKTSKAKVIVIENENVEPFLVHSFVRLSVWTVESSNLVAW